MSAKQNKRLESKKRKAQAFLAIASLNDEDKQKKKSKLELNPEAEKKQKLSDDDSSISKPVRLTSKPLLEGDDYEALKSALRARKKELKQLPKFELKTTGHDASVDNPGNLRTPLFMSDLQHVLAYTMVGDKNPYQPFCWCKMEKWNRLPHVVCLVIEGLSVSDFIQNRDTNDSVKAIEAIFPNKLEFLSPLSYGNKVGQDLSVLPITNKRKKSLLEQYGNMTNVLEKGELFHVYRSMFKIKKPEEKDEQKQLNGGKDEDVKGNLKLRLLLSARQMVEEGYPLPLEGYLGVKYTDYVFTKETYVEAHAQSPMFCIDCEMCMTDKGKMELTRICVVDSDLKVVYHSLVKPHNKITNYLTRFSGITADMLVDTTTRLEDVQAELKRILPPDCILIGQSLNSDLHALNMMHPYVIDTSVIFNITGVRRRKTKLSVLSSIFLNQQIQNNQGDTKGHNPIEDARAAMKLVNLKLEKGYEYGDVILNGKVPNIPSVKDDKDDEKVLGMSMMDLIKKNEKKIKIVCQSDLVDDYKEIPNISEFLVDLDSAKKVVEKTCEVVMDNNLTFCHLDLSEEENTEKKLKRAKKFTKKIWSHVSENGLFVNVWSGRKAENAFVGIAMNRANGLKK